MRTTKIAVVLLVLGAWLAGSSQALAAALPAWKLSVSSQPTNFAPGAEGSLSYGPEYMITATNIGAKETTEPVTITDTLPEGLVPLDVEGLTFGASPGSACGISDQTVTCTFPGPIDPGRLVQVLIPVEVELSGGSIVNEATIEGGGALPATTATTTPIQSEAVPFGFLPGTEGFSAPLNAEDGLPATQAGSHPYQLTVDLGFPTVASGGDFFFTAAGHPKDIVVELPPGEIVNPTATPKCTEAQLTSKAGCPENTQIGMVTVTTYIGVARAP